MYEKLKNIVNNDDDQSISEGEELDRSPELNFE